MTLRIRAVFTAALLVALTARGGSSSSSPTQHLWSGTFHTDLGGGGSTQATLYGAVHGNLSMFFDDDGNVYIFPSTTGASSFAGTIIGISPPGATLDSFGDTDLLYTVDSATSSQSSISGTWSGAFTTGSFGLQPYHPSVGTLSIVPGAWNGTFLHQTTAVRLTMTATGSFTGTDDLGCTLSGQLVPPDPTDDLFAATLHSTGKSICAADFAGYAFETDSDIDGEIDGGTNGHYYYVFVAGAGQSRMIGFKAP